MQLTPGPWELHPHGDNEGDIHGSDGQLVCMMREGDTAPEEDWSADARLICAAPDLLAACKLALTAGDHQYVQFILRDAIAKAEGVTTEGTNGKERSLD